MPGVAMKRARAQAQTEGRREAARREHRAFEALDGGGREPASMVSPTQSWGRSRWHCFVHSESYFNVVDETVPNQVSRLRVVPSGDAAGWPTRRVVKPVSPKRGTALRMAA